MEREAVAREAAREEAGLEVGSAVAVAMEEAGSVVEPTEVAREATENVAVAKVAAAREAEETEGD